MTIVRTRPGEGRRRVAMFAAVLAPLVLTGCVDEVLEVFETISFEESDDPEVRARSEWSEDFRKTSAILSLRREMAETGNTDLIDEMLAIDPDSEDALASKLVHLRQTGADPSEIEAVERSLALNLARDLETHHEEYRDGAPVTAAELEHHLTLAVHQAQHLLLSGWSPMGDIPFEPPGPDDPPERHQLYDEYCETRRQLMDQANDPISYYYQPPCLSG